MLLVLFIVLVVSRKDVATHRTAVGLRQKRLYSLNIIMTNDLKYYECAWHGQVVKRMGSPWCGAGSIPALLGRVSQKLSACRLNQFQQLLTGPGSRKKLQHIFVTTFFVA